MLDHLLNSIFYHLFVKTNSSISGKVLSGRGHVFMLHRILPKNERDQYDINRSLAISPEALQNFIDVFKAMGFEFISMDNVLDHLKKNKEKKFIAFTIDDGYRDNLIHGLPIFEKNNVPFTIYIANCFPNKTANHWWYHIESFLRENDYSFLQDPVFEAVQTENVNKKDRFDLFDEIRSVLLTLSPDQFKDSWSGFLKGKMDAQKKINDSNCLSWNEVHDLSNHDLCTIGAHTINHVALSCQTGETCYKEMKDSKVEIEDTIKKQVDHFSYPYGSLKEVSKRELHLASKIGYKTAVLNHPGSIFKKHYHFPFQIPRMGLSDETDQEKLNRLFNGRLHFDFNGINKLVTLDN